MGTNVSGLVRTAFLLLLCSLGCSESANRAGPAKEVSFGDRQIQQMLSDRPDMRGILQNDHPVTRWIRQTFDGKTYGYRVYWNADTPQSGSASECSPSYEGYPTFIRVSGGTELTPIDRWSLVVFELHNLRKTDSFYEGLTTKAMRGEVSGDQYALACVRSEFKALRQTIAFFETHPLPSSEQGRDKHYSELFTTPDSFEEYCKLFEAADQKPGNYDYFLDFYEESIAPFVDGEPEVDEKVLTDEAS